MDIKRYSVGVCVSTALLFMSCSSDKGDAVYDMTIERLDMAAVCYLSADSTVRDSLDDVFSPAYPLLASMFGAESIDSAMAVYARTPAVEVFAPAVEARMPDIKEYEAALGGMRAALAEKLPGLEFPKHIYGMVTPYRQSVVISDSVLFLGLNHYLGEDYQGYVGLDEYLRRGKVGARIPMDVAEAVVASYYLYGLSEDGGTVLSRMLYDGAIVMVVLETVPGAKVSDVLGWTDDEMSWVKENEPHIWTAIVERGLLYSTDPMDAERLVAPSPATSVLHTDSPGRLGRYIGYRIVKSYMENNPDSGLCDLLSPVFYNSRTALMNSEYMGR